jgi:hypothetical protein
LSVVGVLALVGLTAVAVRVMSADAKGCSSGIKLTVAASPEIAPAVQDAARSWEETKPEVNGKCVRVEVRGVAAADIASALAVRGGGGIDVAAAKPAPTPSESDIPAVWIPDSTAWLGRVNGVDRNALAPDAPSVAMSPVVFAVPESLAQSMAPTLGKAGATGLLQEVLEDAQKAIASNQLPTLKVGVVDPRRDTAGLAGAMIVRNAVVTDANKLPSLIALYRMINRATMPDTAILQKAFAQGVKVAPMSEQAVLAHNAATPNAPLAAVPLGAGGPSLDYPYASLNGKPREIELATSKFRAALLATDYQNPFAQRGFRAPDGTAGAGFPVGHGVTANQVAPNPLSEPDAVDTTLDYWNAANSPSRALALVDLSSSMGLPIAVQNGVPISRMQVYQKASQLGVQLFIDASSLGIWTFTSGHSELAPIAQLNKANRDTINAKIAAVKPSADPESALFLTLRDAYRLMTEKYEQNVNNRIIVFTDGKSSTRGVKSLQTLNREIEAISVVTKPLRVTLIGIGPEVDMGELEEIARITGGVAKRISSPAEIQSVFLAALLD